MTTHNQPRPTGNGPARRETAPRIYRYLVSYLHPQPHGFGYGNVDINVRRPIASRRDVDILARLVREHTGRRDTNVLSFSRYADNVDTREELL